MRSPYLSALNDPSIKNATFYPPLKNAQTLQLTKICQEDLLFDCAHRIASDAPVVAGVFTGEIEPYLVGFKVLQESRFWRGDKFKRAHF